VNVRTDIRGEEIAFNRCLRSEIMSKIREILYAANAAADYSQESLRAQAADIDLSSLERIVEKTVSRAIVLAHAFDTLKDGTMEHPMQAFLHATLCPATGVDLSDDEFYALLSIWGRWCETAQRANTATPVNAFEQFSQRFMRGE
jgi:hypothetical protein